MRNIITLLFLLVCGFTFAQQKSSKAPAGQVMNVRNSNTSYQSYEEQFKKNDAQQQTEVVAPQPVEEKVIDVVEQFPSFPGGQGELMRYISSHLKYPPIAEENGIQGRVIVKFVVCANGSIKDVKVAKGVEPSLDAEAVRLISTMPHWIPGKQNGVAVSTYYTVPVIFKLQ